MNSLAQPTSQAIAQPRRRGLVGWSAIVSGLALFFAAEKAYFPSSWALVGFVITVAFYLGMIPIAQWIASGLTARTSVGDAQTVRRMETLGVAGATLAAATALFAALHWLSAIPAQILTDSLLGVIGLWLIAANVLALRVRLYNRVLAVIGALAGVMWLVVALVMWIELGTGVSGSAVSTLETVRTVGGYVAMGLYLIWALWFGIRVLVRKR